MIALFVDRVFPPAILIRSARMGIRTPDLEGLALVGEQESNLQHTDLRSVALAIELPPLPGDAVSMLFTEHTSANPDRTPRVPPAGTG